MASITIRNLDETTKQALRERAARNGRSMEQEARNLLNALAEDADTGSAPADLSEDDARHRTGNFDDPLSSAIEPAASGSVASGSAAKDKTVLLVIAGGIAAYKSLDLIRRLRERGVRVRCVMTQAATQFVTPMAVGAIAGGQVFTDLWDRASEHDVGHIRLAREADLIVIAPATADILAKMANGLAMDLAGAVLLASKKPILAVPAMNPVMWSHPATRRNVERLRRDGIRFLGPATGEMAEAGESGRGRMVEPMEIVETVETMLDTRPRPLEGLTAIVTSGPTHEPIDPVRYIANRSSGKQGHAIASALAAAGASVTLVSGPVALADPRGIRTIHVETAREMAEAVDACLPCDIAVMVAAVADWRAATTATSKMKKRDGKGPAALELTENPDILKMLGHSERRPRLVVGFAAETEDLVENARGKLKRKRADWIVANDVSPGTGTMGGDRNSVSIIDADSIVVLPQLTKSETAERIVDKISRWFRTNMRTI